jgi:hypothetical protein
MMRGADTSRNGLHVDDCRIQPLGPQKIMKELRTPQKTEFIEKYRRN